MAYPLIESPLFNTFWVDGKLLDRNSEEVKVIYLKEKNILFKYIWFDLGKLLTKFNINEKYNNFLDL